MSSEKWRFRSESSDSERSSIITLPDDDSFDRFGFLQYEEARSGDVFNKSKPVDSSLLATRLAKESERSIKWELMLDALEKGTHSQISTARGKLGSRIRKGIPNDLRGRAWYYLIEGDIAKSNYPDLDNVLENPCMYYHAFDYLKLKGKISAHIKEDIARDLNRTFPRHRMFVSNTEEGDQGRLHLSKVLEWYATIDPEVGYCQGMSFVAALFLVYMPSPDVAFYAFLQCMSKQSEHRLRDMYLPLMIEPQKVLYIFSKLGEKHLPKIFAHMNRQGVDASMYATEWFMTMFCRGFNFEFVGLVMDVYLMEGYKIIYRVALALLRNVEEELLKASFEDLVYALRDVPEKTDAPSLMQMAWEIPVRRADINAFGKHFEEDRRKRESKDSIKL